jgi:hypothetical protein
VPGCSKIRTTLGTADMQRLDPAAIDPERTLDPSTIAARSGVVLDFRSVT